MSQTRYPPQPVVLQTGAVTPGHVASWNTNGIVQDGGTAQNGNVTAIGIQNSGNPAFEINNGPITEPFSAYTEGWLPGTNTFQVGVNSFGGAPATNLQFNINGSIFAFPSAGAGTGNVTGPASSVSGDIVVFNGTSGELISDSGVSISSVVTTTSLDAAFASPPVIGSTLPNAADFTSISAVRLTLSAAATTDAEVPQLGQIQNNSANFSVDTGVANAYVVALTPALTSYTEGMEISFNAQNPNTGASTLNAGAGAKNLFGLASAALQGGEIVGGPTIVRFVSSAFSDAGGWLILSNQGGGLQTGPAKNSLQAPQFQQTVGGVGTSYSNVTGSRSLGTTFTNNTGGPIAVSVGATSTSTAGLAAFINGIEMVLSSEAAAGNTIGIYFIVQPGATYTVDVGSGTGTILIWSELGI